jgi:tol-pal system protein YbgF
MKFLRLALLTLTCSALSFGASKEMIQLQRDVALLQDKMDTMQRTLDQNFAAMKVLLQQTQDNSARTNAAMSNLQDSVSNGVGKSLAPVAGLGSKVDSMGDDMRSLKDSLADLNSRLERMDAKMTDLKNQMQIMQSPPPVPGAPGSSNGAPGNGPGAATGQPGGPSAATPPAGMSADKTYTDARRDLQTGKSDLALQEFQQYLTYFPNTELAPSAQYYIGEIAYNRGDYNGAVQAFDAVLERYPENPKTPDAHLMKGMALMKSGQKNRAAQEFRDLSQTYPHTDDARKAQQQLRQLGVSSSSATVHRKATAR